MNPSATAEEEERLERCKITRAKIIKKLAERASESSASPTVDSASLAQPQQSAATQFQLEAMMMHQTSLPSMGTIGGEVTLSTQGLVPTLDLAPTPALTQETMEKMAYRDAYVKLINDEDTYANRGGHNFYSKADIGQHARRSDETNIDDIQFDFDTCCSDLDHATKKALKRLDTDGNGKISAAELLHAGEDLKNAWKKVIFLILVIVLVAALLFSSTYLAALLSQPFKVTPGGHMAVPGAPEKGKILETAEAKQRIPVALAPLLSLTDMGRVNSIVVSNLIWPDKVACSTGFNDTGTGCPTKMIIKVDIANKISDLKTVFSRTQGVSVTVDRGLIKVANIPGKGSTVFDACGSASCSSIKIAGMDVNALKARARSLGYLNFGRRGEEQKCSNPAGKGNGKAAGKGKPVPEKQSFMQNHKKALIAGGVAAAGIAAVVIAKKTGAKAPVAPAAVKLKAPQLPAPVRPPSLANTYSCFEGNAFMSCR
jgi:hypothetical protein